mmetsp:Transcript_38818/g.124442  ORF Transcript_38818/g.124442 Transcript_38818/m.124442 type:complete len:221 (-) Transcript_38818:3-665(-)
MFAVVALFFFVLPDERAAALQPQTFYRRASFDRVEFGGRLAVDAALDGSASNFSEYVTPYRLVCAAWDPRMVDSLTESTFRLRQEPVDFAGVMRLSTAVTVEVRQRGTALRMKSSDIACLVSFNDERERRLDVGIDLDGTLLPQTDRNNAQLAGSFDFTVEGKLVGPLIFLPDPALSAATQLVTSGIIRYAQDRFVNGIRDDFRNWLLRQQQQQHHRGED